ncbi:MAG: L-aspartate oxidase [Acidobacteriaceae bacterium]|nr:L-aspartate oxidase [Acidobacteriaceae bacterium]
MRSVPNATDYLVIGAGVAGMRAAIELAASGRVLVLAKNELTESATQYAQGGIAAALSDEDEIGLHLQDTLNAGDGLCNPEAAKVLVEEGPDRIQELIEWGTEFDRSGTKLTFTREGAHSRSRILHAHGDSTGREIGRALYAKCTTLKQVTFCEFEFTADLCMGDGRVHGVVLMNDKGERHEVHASAVLLATGGIGQVYRETTNPGVATGDGVAMASRIGAEITDMEFVQFHPTALYVKNAPRFLLSEALRGEGAYLRNMEMFRFMPKYHPMAELAPRDVVARAIAHELEVSKASDPVVYLDLTHLDADRLRARFPRIYSTCMQYNIDIATDLIPVRPAAHYAMGGVRTDLNGRTNMPGLYAAGEVAGTGVHGANRLASNSLLEGLVFGARTGIAAREEHGRFADEPPTSPDRIAALESRGPGAEEVIRAVRDVAWKEIGITRSGSGLRLAIEQLEKWRECLPAKTSRRNCEAHNIHETALLIARSALARRESRGAHYRVDFPTRDDAHFQKHSIIRGTSVRFE